MTVPLPYNQPPSHSPKTRNRAGKPPVGHLSCFTVLWVRNAAGVTQMTLLLPVFVEVTWWNRRMSQPIPARIHNPQNGET